MSTGAVARRLVDGQSLEPPQFLVMKDDTDKGTVDLHAGAAVVINEPQIAETIEEEAHPRAGGPDHFGQCLLADLGDHGDWFRFLTEVGHQE
jgi:hypothetical protein